MTAAGERKMPDLCNRRCPLHYTTALNILEKFDIDIHSIELMAVGEFKNYRGEVQGQEPKAGTPLKRDTRVRLFVGAKSAVDLLPYQFFYGFRGKRPSSGDWEDNARALMAPFDAEVVRHEAKASYQMLKYNFGLLDIDHLRKFMHLFDFIIDEDSLTFEELLTWTGIMPLFNYLSGNIDGVVVILEKLFNYRFEIRENIPAAFDIPKEIRYSLGAKTGRLGKETILGEEFIEADSTYQVKIFDVRQDDMKNFLPGGSKRKRLKKLLAAIMPGHFEYIISPETAEKAAFLGQADRGGYLGYSFTLKT